MAELTVVGFGLFVGVVVLAAMMLMYRKPETPAQARQRLYREAAARDRHIHKLTQDGIQRLNPKVERRKYAPSNSRIQRRMREMEQD